MAPSLSQVLATALLGSLCVSASPRVLHDEVYEAGWEPRRNNNDDDAKTAECPHRVLKKHQFTYGPTSTVWTTTTTTTHHVNCGPCTALHVSRVHLGVGPQIQYTATTTATVPYTTTVLQCGAEMIARNTGAPSSGK
ncbi:nucleolar GTP-binding protein 2 [Purpureocillium lavendulum]|uniref:Nucleolar GTP-binding protein 2 n=1 Tax=Purpureocillium lavendulum TaxID=1247861 RepID=A0AB34FV01_9HYPO|nr:nucleolar GTP-binding protein 2 [Purpureocillium lavendulum]